MTSYAKGTSVPPLRSRMEIERLLSGAGARTVAVVTEPDRAVVFFELADRRVRFEVSMPKPGEMPRRVRASRDRWVEQATRERWRALALALKAKLVAVSSGVETFEEAFLAHVVVPDGQGGATTLGRLALPGVAEAYRTGKLPPLLGAGGSI